MLCYVFTLISGARLVLHNCSIAGDGVVGELTDGSLYRLDDADYTHADRVNCLR